MTTWDHICRDIDTMLTTPSGCEVTLNQNCLEFPHMAALIKDSSCSGLETIELSEQDPSSGGIYRHIVHAPLVRVGRRFLSGFLDAHAEVTLYDSTGVVDTVYLDDVANGYTDWTLSYWNTFRLVRAV